MQEAWRTIPSAPDYEVSSLGRVRSLSRVWRDSRGFLFFRRPRPLKPFMCGPYWAVCLSVNKVAKHRNVHTCVAEAFIGERPPGQVVRHLDGNHVNNVLSNLAYGTYRDNYDDMVRHGRWRPRGGGGKADNQREYEDMEPDARGYVAAGLANNRQIDWGW